MVGGPASNERVFEALWAPRWFGLDQLIAHGQEATFHFRTRPENGGIVMMAAGLDRPRHPVRCRVLGLKHDQLGRLQAIEVEGDMYTFVRHTGDVVKVDAEGGGVCDGLEHAPPDWTVRVVFEVLEV